MFNLFRQSWFYAASDRPKIILFYLLCIMANLVAMTQPLVLARIIDTLQAMGPDVIRHLMGWSALLALLALLFWCFHGPSRVIERRVAFRLYERYVMAIFKKVIAMPLRWHQDHHSGDTIGRVGKSSKALFTFSQTQFQVIELTTRYVGGVAYLTFLSWWIGIVVLSLTVCIFLIVRYMDRRLMSYVHIANEKEHKLSAALYDFIGNIVSVMTLRLGGRAREEISQRFHAMQPPFDDQVVYTEAKWFSMHMCISIMRAMLIALYIFVTLKSGQTLEVSRLVAVFMYLGYVNDAFFGATSYLDRFVQLAADFKAVDELEADYARLGPAAVSVGGERFEDIHVEGLSFAHHEGEDTLHQIADLSFTVRAGQKIALIGTSGAGKTTLLTLLRGLYDAAGVRLTLDGKVHDTLKPLSNFTTLVSQDAEIFANTIRYNLTMGLDVPDPVIEALLAMVDLGELITTLPKGLETDIRERGVNLSGGQKQRLALARGLLAARDSALLLLDEPTSSIDLATESKIFASLFDVYKDKAVIASLHRLHLLPQFDWVIVMEAGRIVQQGPFAELVAAPGLLQTLWTRHVVGKNEGVGEVSVL